MSPDNSRHCLDLLRAGDRERYLTVLFAPEARRAALAALYAFNLETARIRDIVSEPMPGEIRLQWWREVVSGERAGEGRGNPVAAALLDAVETFALPRAALVNLTEARIFDLYNDPMPDRTALEGYLGETASALFQLSAMILDGNAGASASEAAGHAGVAYGIAGLIRGVPLHRARGQVYLPADILSAAGIDAKAWLAGDDREGIARALSILSASAREHLGKAEAQIAALEKSLRPAFLPLAVVAPVLARAGKDGSEAAFRPVALSPLSTQWRFMMRALRG